MKIRTLLARLACAVMNEDCGDGMGVGSAEEVRFSKCCRKVTATPEYCPEGAISRAICGFAPKTRLTRRGPIDSARLLVMCSWIGVLGNFNRSFNLAPEDKKADIA